MEKEVLSSTSLLAPSKNWQPSVEDNIERYYAPSGRRRWEVNYNFNDKIYLTDDERNIFLDAVNRGANIVQIGELTLSALVKFIVPVRNS